MEDFFEYDFDISEICISCYVPKNTGERVHTNRPTHGFAFHLGGLREYVFDTSHTITVKAGDIIYLPKHSNYVVNTYEPADCYAINFQLFSDAVFPVTKIKTKNIPTYKFFFSEAYKIWETKPFGYALKSKSVLYDIIYHIQKEHRISYISHQSAKRILPAIDYIDNNYTKENIDIMMLSKMCDMSDTYFRKIFKSIFGTSPIKYINTLKLNRAKELLETGLYSVHDVASLSGFFDDSYFNREFKKAFSVSPSLQVNKKG